MMEQLFHILVLKEYLMIIVYNILQIIFLVVFFPVLLVLILTKDKYRTRILKRLGYGLSAKLDTSRQRGEKTVWLHALSVGEVTSAVVLIKEMRAQPDLFIVVSTSTQSGSKLAEELLGDHADILLESPVDFYPAVTRYIQAIQPDVFILVETDFWPNMLFGLRRKNIPLFLVNGRISKKSIKGYRRFGFFFRALFDSFDVLSMQTDTDKKNMMKLGIDETKIRTLGNLKYDTHIPTSREKTNFIKQSDHSLVWICGSTHEGEEEIVLSTYAQLKREYHELFLIIAPRNIERAEEIKQLGHTLGLTAGLRSEKHQAQTDFFILDTIGELAAWYHQADIAFIGGSLVDEGGHNPIEAALAGVPVLFGPHMEDFEEISKSLVAAKGAFEVAGTEELTETLRTLLQSEDKRKKHGQLGLQDIQQQKGVVKRHLDMINNFL